MTEQESSAKEETQSASEKLWESWHGLFNFFNDELFESELDKNRVILNCSRTAGRSTLGFYMGFLSDNRGAWIEKDGKDQKAEISMNPAKMVGFSFEEIMATFVHELCHFWQDLYGSPGKNGYHNKQWAEKMIAVGLTPVNNKSPSKITGLSMYHSIIQDGAFSQAFKKMPESLKLPFIGLSQHRPTSQTGYKKWKCPSCKQICRAKESACIACGSCSSEEEIVFMT
jgi:hypothetical protein